MDVADFLENLQLSAQDLAEGQLRAGSSPQAQLKQDEQSLAYKLLSQNWT